MYFSNVSASKSHMFRVSTLTMSSLASHLRPSQPHVLVPAVVVAHAAKERCALNSHIVLIYTHKIHILAKFLHTVPLYTKINFKRWFDKAPFLMFEMLFIDETNYGIIEYELKTGYSYDDLTGRQSWQCKGPVVCGVRYGTGRGLRCRVLCDSRRTRYDPQSLVSATVGRSMRGARASFPNSWYIP